MKPYLSILLLSACGASGQLLSTGSTVAQPRSSAPSSARTESPTPGNSRQQRLELRFAWQKQMPDRVARVVDKLRHIDGEKVTLVTALDLDASIGALDELAESCETKFAGKKISGVADNDQPTVVCPVVAKRSELARKALELAGPAHVAHALATTRHDIEKLAQTRRLPESRLETLLAIAKDPSPKISALREELAPLYQKLGTEAPADLFAGFTQLKPDIEAAYEKAGRETVVGPAAARDAAVEKQVRSFLASDKKLRVLDVRTQSRDWTVILHSNQVPNYRRKDVFALVRFADETHCRLYPMEVRQTYGGGGKWQPGLGSYYIDASMGPYVAKCK